MSIIHKNLQDTADTDPILCDSFLVNGIFTDLYFYSNEFRVVQKNLVKTIAIDFDLTFSIIKNSDEPIGLELIK